MCKRNFRGSLSDTAAYVIGKHFKIQPKYEYEKCCVCSNMAPCLDKKDVIKSSFMDHDYINESQFICVYCAACFGYQMSQSEALRASSFIATNDMFKRLKRHELWAYIEHPPETKYVLAITFSNKKHIAFKSVLNAPGGRIISTDQGNIKIDFNPDLIKIMKNWYRICKNTKQEPTFFTKNDILVGCSNMKRIAEYGEERYLQENNFIKNYRNTESLKVLTFALNKQPIEENKND